MSPKGALPLVYPFVQTAKQNYLRGDEATGANPYFGIPRGVEFAQVSR